MSLPKRNTFSSLSDSERLRFAIETAEVGVYEVDVATGVSRVSDTYINQLGYSRDEWEDTSANWIRLLHPDDRERVLAADRAVAESRSSLLEVEYRMRHKDGSWRWVLDRGKVVESDASGRPTRTAGIHIVIDELQAARDKLREANRRFELAADAANMGFWEYDIVNDRQHWDDRALRLHGLTRAEFSADGEAWRRLVHPEDLPQAIAGAQAAWSGTSDDFMNEFRIIRPDGAVRYMRSFAHISRGPAGEALRMTGVNLDVTAARLAKDELRRALGDAQSARRDADRQRRVAERANRAKTLFLANMSHEVRTPLSALIALSQAMWMESEKHRLPPRFEKFLNRVRSGGKYLNLVLTNLLDVTSAEAGSARLVAESFYLADWVEDMRDILDPIAESHGVRIRWKLPRDGEIRLETDRMRLSQVLLNLAHNAVKFSQAGGKPVDLVVGHGPAGLTLRVDDRGPGIPKAKLKDIFRAFDQHRIADSSFDRGVGLGLAVVGTNLALLGGEIQAKPRKPNGMSFEVRIPTVLAKPPKIGRAKGRSAVKKA